MSDSPTFAETTWLQGAILSAFLYGIVVVFFAMCWRSLWPRIRSHNSGYKKCRLFLCCVVFLFVMATILAVSDAYETQKAFIENRLFPGGPSAFAQTSFSLEFGIGFLLTDWCALILMIWRCMVVYRDTRLYPVVCVLGGLLLVGTVVVGLLWIVIVTRPQRNIGWMSLEFLFPYLCIVLATTIFVSLLTVLRLLYHRHKISRILGTGHGEIYASFAAIVVESAAVYSIFSFIYLIPFAIHNPLADALSQMLGQAQVIASLLIIFRVSEGKGWTRRAPSTDSTMASSIRMRPMPNLTTQPPPTSAAQSHLNVEITLDPETTRDESIGLQKSRYLKEYPEEYPKTDSAPVDSAV
ncbi:hypothetical protein K503DRAFT_710954 [Rhizopogon vinicolor AM-OR11-026]|uniref:Uncharacterized protein n=1 Tax=Rhizopogon vinicolor AM-OR11-026 TaxID=1314800 RepID=A0A1B7NBM0_9AGAM|nr:hypothetical protein K503DRAFT_710954 [Rhizopogon vinicolor AM-OR11-026]